MYNPFKQSQSQKPFLSPLGKHRSLPAVAAPLAVTAVGGVALIVAFGALFGGMANNGAKPPAPAPAVERQAAAPQPAAPPPAGGEDESGAGASPPAAETATEHAAGSAQAALIAPEPSVAGGIAAAPDLDSTAAIPPALGRAQPPLSPDVPVAETEDDVAALEAIQDQEVEDTLGTGEAGTTGAAEAGENQPGEGRPDGGQPDEMTTAQASAAPAMRPAVVKSAVNLRAAADNDAEVLTVVPYGAKIEAEEDCGWCAVTYQGRPGFIYKSFIDYR